MEILAFLAGMRKWPWGLIGCIALAALILGALYFFGEAKYKEGVSAENARWMAKLTQAQHRTDTAENNLQHDTAARRDQSQSRTIERVRVIQSGQTEIANAADTEARYAAYLALRNSLRNAAADHFNRAVSDYVSTVPA